MLKGSQWSSLNGFLTTVKKTFINYGSLRFRENGLCSSLERFRKDFRFKNLLKKYIKKVQYCTAVSLSEHFKLRSRACNIFLSAVWVHYCRQTGLESLFPNLFFLYARIPFACGQEPNLHTQKYAQRVKHIQINQRQPLTCLHVIVLFQVIAASSHTHLWGAVSTHMSCLTLKALCDAIPLCCQYLL